MEFNNKVTWNKNNYQEFVKYLFSLQDLKYKDFHSKLTFADNLIGIKTPILKKIGKDISKTDYSSFIKYNQHKYYEETMIHGSIIGYINDFDEMKRELDLFQKYITNWAICDLTCSNLRIFKKNQEQGYQYILKLVKSDNYWTIRVGVVLLLDYYINETYINKIFEICNNIHNDEYYVKMAVSWLLSICYIKYPNITEEYLKNNLLDDWTYNKTIQKIKESKRIDAKTKIKLEKLKRIKK